MTDEHYRGWHIFPSREGDTGSGFVCMETGGDLVGQGRTVADLKQAIDDLEDGRCRPKASTATGAEVSPGPNPNLPNSLPEQGD